MKFRSRPRGAHLANEGVSARAAEARRRGLVPEKEAAEALGVSVAVLKAVVPPDEWHHHLTRTGRMVRVNYYNLANLLDDEEVRQALAEEAERRRRRRGRLNLLGRAYPVAPVPEGYLWRKRRGRKAWVVTEGDPRDGAFKARPATEEEIKLARSSVLGAINNNASASSGAGAGGGRKK